MTTISKLLAMLRPTLPAVALEAAEDAAAQFARGSHVARLRIRLAHLRGLVPVGRPAGAVGQSARRGVVSGRPSTFGSRAQHAEPTPASRTAGG
jgi:hypothetical protein